jgi:hypothetical protein
MIKNKNNVQCDSLLKIPQKLRDIIHGYIMSDGYVNENGILTVDQSNQQAKFVEWLYGELAEIRTDHPIQDVSPDHPRSKKKSYSKRFFSRSVLVGFHKMWYKPYTNNKGVKAFKKHLPKSINCFFNSTFITLWFAGDGTKIIGSKGVKFEVTALTPGERHTLKTLFKKKFNIEVIINKAGLSRTGNQQWTININASEYQKFRNLITKMNLIQNYFPHKLHRSS